MYKRKKYLGGLKLLLLLLFTMLLGFSSTSYAFDRQDYSDYLDYAIETFSNNLEFGTYGTQARNSLKMVSKETKTQILDFIQNFLNTNNLDLPIRNCTIILKERK